MQTGTMRMTTTKTERSGRVHARWDSREEHSGWRTGSSVWRAGLRYVVWDDDADARETVFHEAVDGADEVEIDDYAGDHADHVPCGHVPQCTRPGGAS